MQSQCTDSIQVWHWSRQLCHTCADHTYYTFFSMLKNVEAQIYIKDYEQAKNIPEPFPKIKNNQAEFGKLRKIWLNMPILLKFWRDIVVIFYQKHGNFKNFLQIVLKIYFPFKIISSFEQKYYYLKECSYFQCLHYF